MFSRNLYTAVSVTLLSYRKLFHRNEIQISSAALSPVKLQIVRPDTDVHCKAINLSVMHVSGKTLEEDRGVMTFKGQ